MWKWGAFLALFLPCAGYAQPTIEIISPRPNACVNNGGELFTGGVPGGQAAPPLHDVPLDLRLSEAQGDPVHLVFRVDGAILYEADYMPPAPNTPEVTDFYVLPSADIADGAVRVLRITATSNNVTREASVSFKLDRHAPRATFPEAVLNRIGACIAGMPPAVMYEVEDALDPAPTNMERTVTEGCQVRRIITLRDNCGNAQEITYATRQPPAAGALTIEFSGVAENARVSRANLVYEIDGSQSCVETVNATYTLNGGMPQGFISGQDLEEAGAYVVTVRVGVCGGQMLQAVRRFSILRRPVADAGGPYECVQGELVDIDGSESFAAPEIGGIVDWGWDLNDDGFFDEEEGDGEATEFDCSVGDGEYDIFLRIVAGNNAIEFDTATVIVRDVNPRCDAGGPYEATEGDQIQLDGSRSAAGHPSDPIRVWDWNFGDNFFPQRAGNLPAPFHTWQEQGEYTVTLRVEDPDSFCEDTAVVVVGDVDPIIAGIGALNADGLQEGQPVTFTAGSTGPGADSEPLMSFAWEFGPPGEREAGQFLRNPTFTYEDDGEFEVCLTVSDADSEVEECFDITVADLQPTALFTGPRLGNEGDEMCFDATDSFAGGEADPIETYTWDFGDGTGPIESDEPITCHVFARNGEVTVTLRVEDEDSRAEPVTQRVTIADVIPQASGRVVYPEGEQAGLEGVPLRLDATASRPGAASDPINSYAWDFGDGTEREGEDLDTVDHAFPDQGTYQVRLTVTDSDGSPVSTSFQVRIENVAPTATIETQSPQVEIGLPATFDAIVVDVDADPPTVTWDMGDGSPQLEGESVEHTYRALGDYVIAITVDDGDGGTAEARLPITVTRQAPRIIAPPRVDGTEGVPLEFTVTVTAARLDDNEVDDLVQVLASNLPPGAVAVVGDAGQPGASRTVTFRWTPSFTSAGRYTVTVQAVAASNTPRRVDIPVTIAEGGTPVLAAAGGTASRGVVTLYQYAFDAMRQVETFTPEFEIDVGAGTGGLAVSPDGRWVFVAVPGHGGVAVIRTGASAAMVRRIPTGALTSSVIWGGDRVYAVVGSTNEIVAIDPVRMKVIGRASLAPLSGAVDLAWIAQGFGGGAAPAHIAVVGQRSGHVALVDPAAVLTGRDAVVAAARVGVRPNRVVAASVDAGWIAVADAKTRRILQIDVGDLSQGGGEPTSTSLPFAATDLTVVGDVVWAATRGGLVQIDADGGVTTHADQDAAAVAPLDVRIKAAGGLIVATGEEIANLVGEQLTNELAADASRVRRLAAFIAIEPSR